MEVERGDVEAWARAELMGMFAWTSELLQTKNASFRRPGVNVTKLFDAKEWSVMSCSAGVVGSAKNFGWFSEEDDRVCGDVDLRPGDVAEDAVEGD